MDSRWLSLKLAKGMQGRGYRGVTFNDLCGTVVTRLALAGATEAEIATIMGHTLRDVRSILAANYLHRDPALAEAAIKNRERELPTELPTVPKCSDWKPRKAQ